jgi:hypothetical protein
MLPLREDGDGIHPSHYRYGYLERIGLVSHSKRRKRIIVPHGGNKIIAELTRATRPPG